MPKGRTLWERMMGTNPELPVEFQHYNPLKAKIGTTIDIKHPDYDFTFFVKEIHEVNRDIDGAHHQFCDYVLQTQTDNGDVVLRLRMNPAENGYKTLLLHHFDELQYEEGFHNTVRSEQINMDDHEGETESYWRPDLGGGNRLLNTWETSQVIVKKDSKSVVAQKAKMDYWDFSRITQDDAGHDCEQFLFVEMDKGNGMFNLWRGSEIDPNRVVII